MANLQLSKNLITLRKLFQYTQLDISKQLNISRQAYTNYETNNRIPDIDTLMRLSSLYNISLDILVNSNIDEQTFIGEMAEPPQPYYPCSNLNDDTLYLSDEEVNIIINYRDSSDSDKKIIKAFLESHKNNSTI